MKKVIIFFFFILSANFAFALTYSSTPPQITQIIPSSILDFQYSSGDTCTFSDNWAGYTKVYEFHRYISKNPPRKTISGDEVSYPVVWLSVFYSSNITPLPKNKVEEKLNGYPALYREKEKQQAGKIVIKNMGIININGYPVAQNYCVEHGLINTILIETQKGNFYLRADVYFDLKEDADNYYKYGETAIKYMLSRIPDVPETGQEGENSNSRLQHGKTTPKEPTMLEKWKAEQKKEYEKQMTTIRQKAAELEYRYSEQYQKDQEEKRAKQAAKEEAERQLTASRYDIEDAFSQAVAESAPLPKSSIIVCDGVTFTYYPDELRKHAKSGETFEVGKWWENKTFAGSEAFKKPIVYMGKNYIPVAYLNNNEITGYLWINEVGEIIKDQNTIRALFTYLNVFGFAAYDIMKEESARFEESAKKCDEEIQSYTYYKDAAKTLKLASNAMSIYLSGSLKGLGSTLSAVDAALFMKKIEMLEASGKTSPDFEPYENLSGTAQNLDSLKDIAKATATAYQMQKLQKELQTLKNIEKIRTNKEAMTAAQASLVDAAASLGWAIFDKAESTGQIAEQSAVIAMKYEQLKNINLLVAYTIKDAQDGINSEQEAKNIFLLPKMKAKAYSIKGDLAATLLQSYRERKTSISGYLGRFVLYVEGKSVDEDKAEETIQKLQDLVDLELESYYKVKIETDVNTNLSCQRASSGNS